MMSFGKASSLKAPGSCMSRGPLSFSGGRLVLIESGWPGRRHKDGLFVAAGLCRRCSAEDGYDVVDAGDLSVAADR